MSPQESLQSALRIITEELDDLRRNTNDYSREADRNRAIELHRKLRHAKRDLDALPADERGPFVDTFSTLTERVLVEVFKVTPEVNNGSR